MRKLLMAGGAVAAAAAAYWWKRRDAALDDEAELVLMARGDRDAVERLVAAERARDPFGNRARWLRAARRRWQGDLR
ncbi:MAG: hypothetical protein H6704_04950 [Myxococcales bacterium]|nr:hypothetical protein [Myxococcales bacterium]MCB9535594.1 hypothetical protein [Myxococcales bacterium]